MSTETTNYVYLVYGDQDVFLTEALYSIGSLLKQPAPANSRIIVFTDRPERMRALPVVCESIVDEINEMKGPHRFGHRIKICALLKCVQMYPGNLIYLDGDTIITGPLEKLAASLRPGRALMHRRERLAKHARQFDGFCTRLPDGRNYRFGPESCMFNAGLIGLHRDDAPVLETVLALCDALLQDGRQNHVCEQFAFSDAFRFAGLEILEASRFVVHYYPKSARRYMHHQIRRITSRQQELWNLAQPIPYSYLHVQWHKLMRKMAR